MTIYLDCDDATILHDLVERRIAEIGPEIHHTHSRAYRDELRRLREALTRLDERLSPASAPDALATFQPRQD